MIQKYQSYDYMDSNQHNTSSQPQTPNILIPKPLLIRSNATDSLSNDTKNNVNSLLFEKPMKKKIKSKNRFFEEEIFSS